jgi:hypothetical protein
MSHRGSGITATVKTTLSLFLRPVASRRDKRDAIMYDEGGINPQAFPGDIHR